MSKIYVPSRNDICWLDYEPTKSVVDEVLLRLISLIGADEVIEKVLNK